MQTAKTKSKIISGAIALLSSTHALGQTDVEARYGQTSQFWSTLTALSESAGESEKIAQLSQETFASGRESLMSLEIRYSGKAPKSLENIFSQGLFGLRGDYLAGGSLKDRIMPEIKGYEFRTGEIQMGLSEPIRAGDAQWGYMVGTVSGVGDQREAHGPLTEFIAHSFDRRSTLFYWGLNLGLSFRNDSGADIYSQTDFSVRPTFFFSEGLNADQRSAWRWKFLNRWGARLNSPFPGSADISVMGVVGQQPIPVEILPRTWDSAHGLVTFPSFGALIGLGSRIQLISEDSKISFGLSGGFFGGYFGAGADLRIYKFSIQGGTWGLETTGAFQSIGTRIQYLGAAFHESI